MGVRSDHKLSADHIPVLYRSCKTTLCFFQYTFSKLQKNSIYIWFFFPAAKDKKGCPPLPRAGQDTSLFPVDEKAVEYYFASDARYWIYLFITFLFYFCTRICVLTCFFYCILFFDLFLSLQCSNWAHQPCDLPRGWWRSCCGRWPTVHPQDKAYCWGLSSPRYPDPADGATANYERWI